MADIIFTEKGALGIRRGFFAAVEPHVYFKISGFCGTIHIDDGKCIGN